MKTQKQLPNDFTFICDIKSRSQLDKLKIDTNGYEINLLNRKYAVSGGKVYCPADKSMLPLINLSDYIDQEQPENSIKFTNFGANNDFYTQSTRLEFKTDGNRILIGQKWQEKTRDGRIEIKEIKQIGNKLAVFGINPNIEIPENSEFYFICNSDGTNRGGNTYWDLLPYNPLLTTLEKELEEVRLKEKELLEKIEELKTK